jgi:Fe2+ transport system protein FeoA
VADTGETNVSKPVPLNRLAAGQSARVDQIQGHPDHVHRLQEFGLLGGTQIEMFRPGNPCIIRLAGNKVCLRSDSLLSVLVRPAV